MTAQINRYLPQYWIWFNTLHIGINDYPGTDADLSGCVNDANDWRKALVAKRFEAISMLDGDATKSNMH